MKLCWADRVGVAWAAIILAWFAYTGVLTGAVAASSALRGLAIFILPIWLGARLVDFIIGGPARRRGQFRVSVQR